MSPPKDPEKYAEWIKLMSKVTRGVKRPPRSEEWKQKQREAHLGNKHTDEAKKKISDKIKGRKLSAGHIMKMSLSKLGNTNWLGKKHKESSRKQIGESNRGKVISEETRRKISISNMGRKPTLETLNKIRETVLKNPRLYNPPTLETRKKMSASQKKKIVPYETRKRMSMAQQGITNEAEWQGFVTIGEYCAKWTDPRLKVRKRVRAWYQGKCFCGKTREQNKNHRMSVHHVSRNKDACCNEDKSDWIFVTLCTSCHNKYGHSKVFEQTLREYIALQYGGKCMYTLEEYNKLFPEGSEQDREWGGSNGY
jgi:hypothetical protein